MRRTRKFVRPRLVALTVGVGALGSLAFAPAALAAGAGPKPPAIGSNCQADGHISGAGSTFQTNLLNNSLTYGFQQDICGPAPAPTNLASAWGTTDPSLFTATVSNVATPVSGMVAYNYSLSGNAAKNGSGAGINRISCRTDEFAGTDLPYNSNQLTQMDAAPGTAAGNCNTALNLSQTPPPFNPTLASYPNASDGTQNVMSFPTAGGAVAIAANLNGVCTGGTPGSLNITATELDMIFQGTINQWDDTHLTATNPILTTDSCSGPITRIVRFDNSGTTAITMFTLNGIDSAPLCQHGTNATWLAIAISSPNNGQWPSGCIDGGSHTDLPVETSGTNGSGNLITLLETNTKPVFNTTSQTYTTLGGEGGIGYAELGLWGTPPAGVSFIHIEDATDFGTFGTSDTPPAAVFQTPGTAGNSSKCTIGVPGLPGSQLPNEAVGLGLTDNWANDQTGSNNKVDIAFAGSSYPVCGMTFDFVYTGMHNEAGEVASPSGGTATPGCVLPAPSTQAAGTQPVPLASNTLTVDSTAGLPSSGAVSVLDNTGVLETLTYTGKSATTLTGIPAQGAPGGPLGTTIATTVSGAQSISPPSTTLTVASTAGFPATGTLTVNTSTGLQTLSYTVASGNMFTLAGGTAATVADTTAVNLVSTFNDEAGINFVYAGVTDVAQALPLTTLTMTSTANFPKAGSVTVTSSTGSQTLTYTGKTTTSLTGVSGGTGSVAAGAVVSVLSTTQAAAPPTTTGLPIPSSPGVMGSCQTTGGPEIGTTNDQLRTLYSYFEFVFSPLGQSYLGQATYDSLPTTWLPKLLQGYQFNF